MFKKLLIWFIAISILVATLHLNLSYVDHEHQFTLDLQSEINVSGHSK
jgi:hypothetical protein